MNRREFIYSTPAALFFSGFPNFALASQKKLGRMCIIILEGGLDGIAAVPPIGDRNLPKLRKDLIIENELFNDNYLKLSIGKKRHIKIELI